MGRLTPVLMVDDIKKTIAFYEENFNFQVDMIVPNEEKAEFASIINNKVEIFLQEKESMKKEFPVLARKEKGGTFSLYIDVDDVFEMYEKCKANQLTIVREMDHREYNAYEFGVLDNNGYILEFTTRS